MTKKINDFIVFCVEVYKVDKDMTGKEVYDLFFKYGVLDYLKNGYEMLHTQGDAWIVNDIDKFLLVRGYNN